jgi:hypothetical protein
MPKPCSAARVLWKCARTLESGFGVSLPVAESLAVRYCRSLEARAMDFRLSKAQQRLQQKCRARSASVIDRLLKNQNPLDNRNNLRSSSPHPGRRQTSGEPRRNFAVQNSSTREPWLFRSPVFGSGIRRLDGEAVGGRRLARTPPRRATRWLAVSTIAPPAPSDRGAIFSRR